MTSCDPSQSQNSTDDPATSEGLADLIKRGRTSDRRALEHLIGRYQNRIARFVVAQTGDGDEYEDVCQVIFIKMVVGLPKLRASERFEAWLFQIARNACQDHLRNRAKRQRTLVALDVEHESVRGYQPAVALADEHAMKEALAQLPPSQRHILELVLDRKRSYAELANLLNVSVGALKSRLHRARVNLIRIIGSGGSE